MSGRPRLVLGIDPGTATLGYGLLREEAGKPRLVGYGALTTRARQPHPERLLQLYTGLRCVITEHRPTEVAIEQLFFARNARSALAVGEARGVAVLAAIQAGLPIYEYTPLQVKQAIGGYGRATKAQLGEMIRLMLGLDTAPAPDDAADAVAIGLCHLSWRQHSQALRAAGEANGEERP